MKSAKFVSMIVLLGAVLVGCSGNVSVSDVQKEAKAQQDWLKAHPGREDSHTEQ